MFLELIATFAAGFAGAGVVLILASLTRGRVPRRAAPAVAGAVMIAFVIWSEYSWFPRTEDALPEGLEVATTAENQAPWRPWTYVFPYTERFIAVDLATMRTNDAVPGQRLAELYFFQRWMPVNRMVVLLDCEGARIADLGADAGFDDEGRITGATWRAVGADDPILRTACAPPTG